MLAQYYFYIDLASFQIRYSVPEFVEHLQDSCNNLLHHWHYYNTDEWPDLLSYPDRHKTSLAHLPSYQHALVLDAYEDTQIRGQLDLWKMYKENNGRGKFRLHRE